MAFECSLEVWRHPEQWCKKTAAPPGTWVARRLWYLSSRMAPPKALPCPPQCDLGHVPKFPLLHTETANTSVCLNCHGDGNGGPG